MNETLQKIRQETLERLKAAKDESEIESLSVSVFGKSGSLTEILKSMGKLSKEERASVGQSVNAVKKSSAGARLRSPQGCRNCALSGKP